MLNIPWYAWLNIIGLLLIWLLHIIGHWSNNSQHTIKWLGHFKILALIFFIFLNWNKTFIFDLSYYLICVAVIVTILVAWDIAMSLLELFISTSRRLKNFNAVSSNLMFYLGVRYFQNEPAFEQKSTNNIQLLMDFASISFIIAALIPPVYIAVKLSIASLS